MGDIARDVTKAVLDVQMEAQERLARGGVPSEREGASELLAYLPEGSDAEILRAAVAADGMTAGVDAQYVKPGDARIVAHTDMIGGGETTSVTFDVAKIRDGGPYQFFCSFPGHSMLMKGKLVVTK